ncbi:2-dehydropantoate 2-reductase [Polynucleobacter sp. IMCC30063]|uniref:2-dehydropantoate 2-reductase n=1 Tax=unclassified Polynucleobacter TaxID=2640945 RepID=UPI001F4709D4|nr:MULTISPECIES: 2-dehydropantoate 2-reductase [unclassified Polynucleobacter]MCE7506692.1 2-dehydropantoate 2-reductase [Polynucleobacter sp. IMCC30063]MCE7526616.1 2-dehydropantoate 2-reductase [Polynucleobacter sp. IMCC 30228]
MSKKMKILIVGAGGIGGYFGAKLIQVGADITYLLRPKRHEYIQANGLTIETPRGSFVLHPKSITLDQLEPIYDLVILAPKAFDLANCLNELEKVGPKALFLPFLNGLTHLDALDQQFGRARVMGGVAHIAAMITEVGAVKQLSDLHILTVGHRAPEQEAIARAFFALCEKADFDHFYSEQIEQAMWDKWVFLASLAGMTTLCQGSVGQIVATPYGQELSLEMYAECCAIAQANGFSIAEQARKKAIELLTQVGSPFTASMLRDLIAKQKTEHEHILGQMIQKGMSIKVSCPLVKMAYTHMAVSAQQ